MLEELVPNQLARHEFPVEMHQEEHDDSHDEGDPIDGIEDDDNFGDDMQEVPDKRKGNVGRNGTPWEVER